MLYLLDANILIYSKIATMPEHNMVSKWLAGLVSSMSHQILVSETTLLAFLRITSNPRAFSPPLQISEARSFIDGLTARKNVSIFRPSREHFKRVAEFAEIHSFLGNKIMDAHLAVIALASGATLATRDKDFASVPYLNLIDPLTI